MDDEDSYTEGREDRRRRPEKGGLTVLAPPGPGCEGSERQAGEDLATNFLDDIVVSSNYTYPAGPRQHLSTKLILLSGELNGPCLFKIRYGSNINNSLASRPTTFSA
jgi:hypothetical protein